MNDKNMNSRVDIMKNRDEGDGFLTNVYKWREIGR